METAYEFLQRKGISKVYQPNKRYNLTIAELVEFLDEFATGSLHYVLIRDEQLRKSSGELIERGSTA
jgi:hypothetical protein